MRVVKLMVFMTLLMLVNSVSADTRIPPSALGGARSDYTSSSSAVTVLANFFKYVSGSLQGDDRRMHINTIIFAASNLDNGQYAEWSNPHSNSAGRIKVVLTEPVQGGFCRLLYTEVEKDSNVTEYKEYACKTIDSQYWTFYSR